jgi:hypothetical protein
MRAVVARKLTALGYSTGKKLKLPGVEAICVQDPLGQSMLLVSNVFYGPSWAQIYKSVEHLIPTPNLITLGKTPAVLMADSTSNRELIRSLFETANTSRSKQVHLDGVGFVELETKAKPELKLFALPLISIFLVVGLGIFWSSSQQQSQEQNEGEEAISQLRILALLMETSLSLIVGSASLYRISQHSVSGQEIQMNTGLGELTVLVESIIGSAAKISGVAECSDGRKRAINHRVDTSGSGAVLELGQ